MIFTAPPQWLTHAGRLGVPAMSLEIVLTAIRRAGYITDTADDPPLYLPIRSFETISVKELLDTLRAAEDSF